VIYGLGGSGPAALPYPLDATLRNVAPVGGRPMRCRDDRTGRGPDGAAGYRPPSGRAPCRIDGCSRRL